MVKAEFIQCRDQRLWCGLFGAGTIFRFSTKALEEGSILQMTPDLQKNLNNSAAKLVELNWHWISHRVDQASIHSTKEQVRVREKEVDSYTWIRVPTTWCALNGLAGRRRADQTYKWAQQQITEYHSLLCFQIILTLSRSQKWSSALAQLLLFLYVFYYIIFLILSFIMWLHYFLKDHCLTNPHSIDRI